MCWKYGLVMCGNAKKRGPDGSTPPSNTLLLHSYTALTLYAAVMFYLEADSKYYNFYNA